MKLDNDYKEWSKIMTLCLFLIMQWKTGMSKLLSAFFWRLTTSFNPGPVREDLCNPLTFLSWMPHSLEYGLEYRVEILHRLWGIFAQLLVKNWSGHEVMTSLEEQPPTKFQRNRDKTQLGVVRLTWMLIVDVIGVSTWLDVTLGIASWVSRSTKVTWGHWPRLTS